MQTAGITLLLDLYECKSPAINNAEVLDQLFVSALQLAGFEVVTVDATFPQPGRGHRLCLTRCPRIIACVARIRIRLR